MKTWIEKRLNALTLQQVDHGLEIFCVALLSPLMFVKVSKTEIYDVLTYASFVFTVWSAAFAGRAIFASKSRAQADTLTRACFTASLFFVLSAALLLIPTVYRSSEHVLLSCLISTCVIYTIGASVAGVIKFGEDSRHPVVRTLIPLLFALVDAGLIRAAVIVW